METDVALYHGIQSYSPVESANEFNQRLELSLEEALFAHKLAKSCNDAYVTNKYTPPSTKKSDNVSLNRSTFKD